MQQSTAVLLPQLLLLLSFILCISTQQIVLAQQTDNNAAFTGKLIYATSPSFPAQLPSIVLGEFTETYYSGVDKLWVYQVPLFATFTFIAGFVFVVTCTFLLASFIWQRCADKFFKCAQLPVLKGVFLLLEAFLIVLISPEPRRKVPKINKYESVASIQQLQPLPSIRSMAQMKKSSKSTVRKLRSTVHNLERYVSNNITT